MAAQPSLDGLLASPRWQMHFPSVRCVVLFDQGRQYALAHKGVHGGAIQLPRSARTQLTLLHELAHLASLPATVGHGPAFAGIYLMLVQHCMEKRIAVQLERHFSAHRVHVQAYEGPRHHFFVLTRRAVACQDRAARERPAPGTSCP